MLKDYLGCEAVISNKEIKHQKTKFTITFRVTIKENSISDFIILPGSAGDEEELNYNSIILGFANGCMKSMCYHPEVKMGNSGEVKSSVIFGGNSETVFDVEMWKEKE